MVVGIPVSVYAILVTSYVRCLVLCLSCWGIRIRGRWVYKVSVLRSAGSRPADPWEWLGRRRCPGNWRYCCRLGLQLGSPTNGWKVLVLIVREPLDPPTTTGRLPWLSGGLGGFPSLGVEGRSRRR